MALLIIELDKRIGNAKEWRDTFNQQIPDLPIRISELLSVHGVAPDRIQLEITESAVMGKPEAAIQILRRLADQGIDLTIDDFGVGQSSFAYLRRLPVRELKIDKSFMMKLAEVSADRTIVSSIVELGHRLGYREIAAGQGISCLRQRPQTGRCRPPQKRVRRQFYAAVVRRHR